MNNRIDRLLPCCAAALLSLGLAACNTTGGGTGNGGAAPTAQTTELAKAQAAANAAQKSRTEVEKARDKAKADLAAAEKARDEANRKAAVARTNAAKALNAQKAAEAKAALARTNEATAKAAQREAEQAREAAIAARQRAEQAQREAEQARAAAIAARQRAEQAKGALERAQQAELGQARTAAVTAMEAAKKQSDAADTEADKAEAALTGDFVMLQTGKQHKKAQTHAAVARAAAKAAMTAYETAKAESAKAAAATTITAAVEARTRAQAALKTAQAQQKIAMDKAAEAVKAAGMAVKVSQTEGQTTYKVGEVTIVPGAEKMEKTVNGKTVITGLIKDILSINSYNASPVTYQAAGVETPERLAQPTVAARKVIVGSVTDSSDDSMRLVLFDKYGKAGETTNEGFGIYRVRSNPTAEWAFPGNFGDTAQLPDGTKTPYGWVNRPGKQAVIKKSNLRFYKVTSSVDPRAKPTNGLSANANELTIAADTEPETLYYYVNEDNKTVWLKRVGIFTADNSEPGAQLGLRYSIVHALEDVRFPTAKDFKHLNYGIWAGLKEDGNTLADLGTGFVSKLPDGSVTPSNDIPTSGSATYEGGWTANVRVAKSDGTGAINNVSNEMTATADFGANTLQATLTGLATLKGDIDGNSFAGTNVGDIKNTYGLDKSVGNFEGEFSGNFFGPKAEELGGVFDFTSEGARAGEFRGAFGGGRITD
ncbi:transferrin-binding protein-like solute binding protein [Hoeflea sp.]|uniref:transferrin-binding protein-like solute binding protein n=1 Tax=Hoeflea sp. TaxID=1940281 RepID=UPI003B02644F